MIESFQRGASFKTESDDDYLIRNKEINLLEPVAETIALAMPHNIRCVDCSAPESDSNLASDSSCIYSEDSTSSSPFSAALGGLSLSQKNFKN